MDAQTVNDNLVLNLEEMMSIIEKLKKVPLCSSEVRTHSSMLDELKKLANDKEKKYNVIGAIFGIKVVIDNTLSPNEFQLVYNMKDVFEYVERTKDYDFLKGFFIQEQRLSFKNEKK